MSCNQNATIGCDGDVRHGHIFAPASRAYFAEQEGQIEGNKHNGIEAGKFFPATVGGLRDVFAPDDVANIAPPADGKIASGGQKGVEYLDRTDIDWKKHAVVAGESLNFIWYFSALHKSRRFNYFITREDWDPSLPLSRAQFEPVPFASFTNHLQPYWQYSDAEMHPAQPTINTLKLPEREGYHVILGVWEVADTSMAFYQVVDVEFAAKDEGDKRPDAPENLQFESVTAKNITLKWEASAAGLPVHHYRILRDGMLIATVDGTQMQYHDDTVTPLTQYVYTVVAVNERDIESRPAKPITTVTPGEEGENSPPAAPTGLHVMGSTASSIHVMWNTAISVSPVAQYVVYRDDREAQRLSATVLEWKDEELQPDTLYRYAVTAVDIDGRESAPSNSIEVRTGKAESVYPAWQLNQRYRAGDIITNLGKYWRCIATHTAYVESWAPGAADGFTLWSEFTPS